MAINSVKSYLLIHLMSLISSPDMDASKFLLLVVIVCICRTNEQDMRSFRLAQLTGWQFQCSNTTCSPFLTIIVTSMHKCRIACLAATYCKAVSFYHSNFNCQLFISVPNSNGNMLINAVITSMIVVPETRIPIG